MGARHRDCQKSLYVGGRVTQSVKSVTPGEEVLGLIHSVAALSILVGSVLV